MSPKRVAVNPGWPGQLSNLATIPEVVEQIFKHLDVKNLKSCRYVCPIWNGEACRVLQRKSHVYLLEEASRKVNDFLELIDQNGNSCNEPSPCPFRRLFVSIESFSSQSMYKVLSHREITLVELYLNEAPSENDSEFQNRLHEILLKNSGTLRYFRVALKTGINPGTAALVPEPLKLPALKDFGFWEIHGGSDKEDSIDFLVQIINAAPNLEQLCSSCMDANVLSSILIKCNFRKLEHFYAESIRGHHVGLLSKTDMPNLRTLILQGDVDSIPFEHRASSEDLQNMVLHFAETLEELNISWISSTEDESFPTCPKLKTLNIDGWDGSLGVFDSFRLPSLKQICVTDHEEEENSIIHPHEGVESFSIENTNRIDPADAAAIEEFDYLLLYCRYQYPNLKHLDLTMGLNDEVVRSVIRTLPLLESLTLDTSCHLSSSVFTGRNQLACERFLDEGQSIAEIALMPSLRDMRSLKKLVVGRYSRTLRPNGFRITNLMVEYGIAEIPSLKFFQLNWDSDLSVPVFIKSLGHLEQIIINNAGDSDIQDSILLLQTKMVQVELQSNLL